MLPGWAPFTQSLRGSAPSSQPFLASIRFGSLGRRSRRRQHSHRKVSREPSEAWAAPPRSHFEKLAPVAVLARPAVTSREGWLRRGCGRARMRVKFFAARGGLQAAGPEVLRLLAAWVGSVGTSALGRPTCNG